MSTSPPNDSGGMSAGVDKERASLGQRVGALGGVGYGEVGGWCCGD